MSPPPLELVREYLTPQERKRGAFNKSGPVQRTTLGVLVGLAEGIQPTVAKSVPVPKITATARPKPRAKPTPQAVVKAVEKALSGSWPYPIRGLSGD